LTLFPSQLKDATVTFIALPANDINERLQEFTERQIFKFI